MGVQVRQSIEVISPRIAADYLKHNDGNRQLRVAHVNSLAGAMERGEWRLTHQGIAFATSGRLLDGQHRLHAVIQSGISVPVVVVRDLADDTFMAVDIGNRRTAADVLGKDQKVVEVASLICHILTGRTRSTPDEVNQWLRRISDQHNNLVCTKSSARVVSCAGMRLAAILSVSDGQSDTYVRNMYAALVSGDMEALPPIGRSLIAQIASGTVGGRGSGRATSLFALARGMVVFDQAKADLRRVLVKDTATSLAWARDVLRQMEAQP